MSNRGRRRGEETRLRYMSVFLILIKHTQLSSLTGTRFIWTIRSLGWRRERGMERERGAWRKCCTAHCGATSIKGIAESSIKAGYWGSLGATLDILPLFQGWGEGGRRGGGVVVRSGGVVKRQVAVGHYSSCCATYCWNHHHGYVICNFIWIHRLKQRGWTKTTSK